MQASHCEELIRQHPQCHQEIEDLSENSILLESSYVLAVMFKSVQTRLSLLFQRTLNDQIGVQDSRPHYYDLDKQTCTKHAIYKLAASDYKCKRYATNAKHGTH